MHDKFEVSDAPSGDVAGKSGKWTTNTLLVSCVVVAVIVGVLCTVLTFFLHPQYSPNGSSGMFSPIESDPTRPETVEPTERGVSTRSPSVEPTEGSEPMVTPTEAPENPSHTVRINCLPDRDLQENPEDICGDRGCLWKATEAPGQPLCSFPHDYGTYHVVREETFPWGIRIRMDRDRKVPSFFGQDVPSLVVDIEYQTEDRLHFKVSIVVGGGDVDVSRLCYALPEALWCCHLPLIVS